MGNGEISGVCRTNDRLEGERELQALVPVLACIADY